MTRKIKFRAWCPIQKKMFTPFTLEEAIDETNARWHKEEDVLMQFTGLKDKNGKEIYEGDVVRYDGGNIFCIEFKFGKWLSVNKKDDLKTGVLFDLLDDLVEIEVIGNIYQNPELKPSH